MLEAIEDETFPDILDWLTVMLGDPRLHPTRLMWIPKGSGNEPPPACEKEKPVNQMDVMNETSKALSDSFASYMQNQREDQQQMQQQMQRHLQHQEFPDVIFHCANILDVMVALGLVRQCTTGKDLLNRA